MSIESPTSNPDPVSQQTPQQRQRLIVRVVAMLLAVVSMSIVCIAFTTSWIADMPIVLKVFMLLCLFALALYGRGVARKLARR
jgi:uncharacterized RDD family membrane protein YckC